METDDLLNKLIEPGEECVPIVLFLGAGVNGTLLPQWSKLIETLAGEAVGDLPYEMDIRCEIEKWLAGTSLLDPYAKASIIRGRLGASYVDTLRDTLFANFGLNAVDDTSAPFLKAVARLSQQERVCAVVTYNFDNVLELVVEGDAVCRRKLFSVFGGIQKLVPPGTLPVYHVHGCLGRDSSAKELDCDSLIFARDDYHRFALNPSAWQVTTQLHFLRNCFCLFLGTSLSDMNLVRIADHAKVCASTPGVFAIMANEDFLREESESSYDSNAWKAKTSLLKGLYKDIGVEVVLASARADVVNFLKDLALALQ